MKNLKPALILSGLAIIGYSLFRYYKKQAEFLKDISYKIVGVRIVRFSSNSVSLNIDAQIYNASNVEATVRQMYLDFFINGIKVGNINEVKDIIIYPMKTSTVSFNFSFNPKMIGQNLVDIISVSVGAKDLIFDIQGFVKIKSSFISATLPFEYTNNLKSLIKK
jgi:LEA14-like dessication related protein